MSTKLSHRTKVVNVSKKEVGIIIDKSFLRGASSDRIKDISQKYTLLMSEALLYEVVKDDSFRSSLFRKISAQEKFLVIPNVSHYFTQEAKTRKYAESPLRSVSVRDYSFSKTLSNEDFVLPKKYVDEVESTWLFIDSLKNVAIQVGRELSAEFPAAFKGPDSERIVAMSRLEHKISKDSSFIRRQFKKMELNNKLSGDAIKSLSPLITHRWAHYRWLQVLMLLGIDLAHRFNLENKLADSTHERMRHDVLDAQYLLPALLGGAIATKDDNLIRWWGILAKTKDKIYIE